MKDASELAALLESIPQKLLTEKRRFYGPDWSDWENGSTENANPAVYALWGSLSDEYPQYVGRTTGLERRLGQHFSRRYEKYWNPPITHVSFIELEQFNKPDVLSAAEAFTISVLEPPQNSETWKEIDDA